MGSHCVLGALDRTELLASKLEHKTMEDSRIFHTVRRCVPFSALTDKEMAEIAPRVIPTRTPARLPVGGNSVELGKNVVLIMSGTFEVRCQVLVSRHALGLNQTGEPLAFSDVPIISLSRGSMWNADLVLSTESERDWCTGVEFSRHNLYPRSEGGKCLVVNLKALTNFCWHCKTMRRAMDAYLKVFRNHRRSSVYQVISTICKPDFQAKVSGYMKDIIQTIDEAEGSWPRQLRKFEVELLEDINNADHNGGKVLAGAAGDSRGGEGGLTGLRKENKNRTKLDKLL